MKPSFDIRIQMISRIITFVALIIIVLSFGATLSMKSSWLRPIPTTNNAVFMPNKVLGVVVDEQLIIRDMEPGSAAEKGGLHIGDKVVSIYGKTVTTLPELIAQVHYARGYAETFPNGKIDPQSPDFPDRRALMEQARKEIIIGVEQQGKITTSTLSLELPYVARRSMGQSQLPPTSVSKEPVVVPSRDVPTVIPPRGGPTNVPVPTVITNKEQPTNHTETRPIEDLKGTPTPVPITMFYF